MLLTNVLFLSLVESSLMSKKRFTLPGTMTSSLPKLGNLTVELILVNLTGIVNNNYLLSHSFYPVSHSQRMLWTQFSPEFHFKVLEDISLNLKHYSCHQAIGHDVIFHMFYSQD